MQPTINDLPKRAFRPLIFAVMNLAAIVGLAACSGSEQSMRADSSSEMVQTTAAMPSVAMSDAGDDAAMEEPDQAVADGVASDERALVETESESATAAQADEGDETAEGEAGAGATPQVTTPTRTAADLGRKIIFNADISVEVDDVAAAGQQATEAVTGLGGFVYGEESRSGTNPSTTLTFKVLPTDFDAAIAALGSVGELRTQTITANDVTDRIVDLDTRIEVAELGVARLRETLGATSDLADYAELERLLLQRETDLEVMRAQIRNLQDQVSLATITVTFVQDQINHGIAVTASIYESQDEGRSCPGDRREEGGWVLPEGADVTVCFEILNSGEEPVVDLAVIDPALGIDSADEMILVFGSLDRIEAGQSVILATEFQAERNRRLRTKVTARPADSDGAVSGPSVDASVNLSLDTFEEQEDPGFFDGFDAGVGVLKAAWSAAKVIVGFLLPLLVLAPFAAVAWFLLRNANRRRRNRGPRRPREVKTRTLADHGPPPDSSAASGVTRMPAEPATGGPGAGDFDAGGDPTTIYGDPQMPPPPPPPQQ